MTERVSSRWPLKELRSVVDAGLDFQLMLTILITTTICQNALSYSKERLQGRSPSGIKFPDKSADPLICHPDISKSLLTIKVFNEGCRALVSLVAQQVDIMLSHPNNQNRNDAREFVALMTPIIKAFLSDLGFEATNSALHIWGGHGYIQDNELEQFTRDAKITQIYEGTSEIQRVVIARDLLK